MRRYKHGTCDCCGGFVRCVEVYVEETPVLMACKVCNPMDFLELGEVGTTDKVNLSSASNEISA